MIPKTMENWGVRILRAIDTSCEGHIEVKGLWKKSAFKERKIIVQTWGHGDNVPRDEACVVQLISSSVLCVCSAEELECYLHDFLCCAPFSNVT